MSKDRSKKMAAPPAASFVWAGQRLSFRAGEVNGKDDLEVFRATGMSLMDIVSVLEDNKISLFGVAAMIWVARKQAGEKVSLDDQLAVTTMNSVQDLIESFSDEEEVVDPPA